MYKVCFVCYGNICRSPMAEFVFKDLIHSNNKRYKISCFSRGTSFEEIGNDIYPEAREVLESHNIKVEKHRAKRFCKDEYNDCDFIIVMEEMNKRDLLNIIGSDNKNKVYKLREFTIDNTDIEDPWYTGRFDKVYNEINDGCIALFNYIVGLGDKNEV